MIRVATKVLAAGACLTLIASAGFWYLTGGRLYGVQTDSMRPTFKAGDAVLVQPIDTARLRSGMVVSYRDRTDPKLMLSHRVIQHDRFGLITKGDNNPEADLPIATGAIAGQVYAVAPRLGAVMQWLQTPAGLVMAVYLPATLAVVVILARLMRAGQGIYRVR